MVRASHRDKGKGKGRQPRNDGKGKSAPKGDKGKGKGKVDKRNVQCHNCLRYGHYANECWQRKGSAQVGQVAESEVSTVAPSASVSQAHVKRVEIDLTADCTYDFSGSVCMIVASSAGSNLLPMVGASDAGSELQSDSSCFRGSPLARDWLRAAKGLANYKRDYLLPRLRDDMAGFDKKMAGYGDAVVATAALLTRLQLPGVVQGFWTEHSEIDRRGPDLRERFARTLEAGTLRCLREVLWRTCG